MQSDTSLEQSIKKRLGLIAKERNITPAQIWHHVISERFLVRLCHSRYRDHFILKGGTLLAKHIDIGRETMDLDFSIKKLSNEIGILQKAFDEIAKVQINDGFVFATPSVAPLEHFHMQYPGAQVKLEVRFGKSKFSLFIDLGFGDLVYSREKEIRLLSSTNGPLFEEAITIGCYPPEFIFAEKLETVIYRGSANSRMKDFHDLYSLINAGILNKEGTLKAIRLVFNHRNTQLLLLIQFDEAQLAAVQNYWSRYHPILPALARLPNEIEEVIKVINEFILI